MLLLIALVHLGGVANLAASYDLSAAYWASLYQQATQVASWWISWITAWHDEFTSSEKTREIARSLEAPGDGIFSNSGVGAD